MKTEFDEYPQIDVVMLDDGELPSNILDQFPTAILEYQDLTLTQPSSPMLPRVRPGHWGITMLLFFLIAGALFGGMALFGGAEESTPAQDQQTCLVIHDSMALVYKSYMGTEIVGNIRQNQSHSVLDQAANRYQIEDGWVDKLTVQVEEITCPIEDF